MSDLVNPYANPYLPTFANQRPRINDTKPVQPQYIPTQYSQIHPVNGFDGARSYASNLAPGSSEIVSESDPNIARVYIVAKDMTGQIIVEGYSIFHEEEPKPVTMDDLNSKINELLDRIDKLEEGKNNDKPGDRINGETNVWQLGPETQVCNEPSSVTTTAATKRSKNG